MDTEIEKHIVEMESREYIFAKRFSKRDYIVCGCVAILCIVILVLGVYL